MVEVAHQPLAHLQTSVYNRPPFAEIASVRFKTSRDYTRCRKPHL